ncbi:hypothetical protein VU07_02365 [Desulfobulbus sp. F4]|nr:hypothetical protein [Desulfobulbus sp. F4]
MEIKERGRLGFEETASRLGISKSSVSRWANAQERFPQCHGKTCLTGIRRDVPAADGSGNG